MLSSAPRVLPRGSSAGAAGAAPGGGAERVRAGRAA